MEVADRTNQDSPARFRFGLRNLRRPLELARKLLESDDPVSNYIRSSAQADIQCLRSLDERRAREAGAGSTETEIQLRHALVSLLNRLLSDGALREANEDLYFSIADRMERFEGGTQQMRCNRLFLAVSYPNEVTIVEYYVALDLGSESMAAYFEQKRGGASGMIELQHYASSLITPGGGSAIAYLFDDDETAGRTPSPSPRLRTLIALEDSRQPGTLPPEHATLRFVNGDGTVIHGSYKESLFDYFYTKDRALARKVLPNPKILFQYGARKVIPAVTSSTGEDVQHDPESIIQHLTTQTLRNLVQRSPQLEDLDVLPEEIHLMLSIPNVYSLVHKDSLESFVREHTSFGRIETIYESDAVAYALWPDPSRDAPEAMRSFHRRLHDLRRQHGEVYLVTIDVGRGTTDASLIRIAANGGDARENGTVPPHIEHEVLSRAGRSDGGNRLSYILATYFNSRVNQVFEDHKAALGGRSVPFDFLHSVRPHEKISGQESVVDLLLRHVEEIKRRLEHNYRLGADFSDEPARIKSIVDRLLNAIYGELPTEVRAVHVLRQDLEQALSLPTGYRLHDLIKPPSFSERLRRSIMNGLSRLPGIASLLSRLSPATLEALRRPLPEPRPGIGELVRQMQDYVRRNSESLIEDLESMAQEELPPPWRLPVDRTLVLIAGRASQFEPLRTRIYEQITSRYNIPGDQILHLNGRHAKEACCRGAVEFRRLEPEIVAARRLYGYYGFKGQGQIERVDMNRIRNGGTDRVTIEGIPYDYWLIYMPSRPTDDPSRDSIAEIERFSGNTFDFRYDPEQLKIFVNGMPVDRVRTYGDVDEEIYHKVWPEALRPVTGSA